MIWQSIRVLLGTGLGGLAVLAVWPYHDGVLRYGLPLSLAAAWLAALGLAWRRKIARVLVAALPVVAVIPFCLPAKPMEPEALRGHYLAAMRGMEGAAYVWGGERHRGVDCSGLPRLALRDALWQEGVDHRNGGAFREWARQWWFDTSARALGSNHRGFTRPTGVRGKLRALDPAALTPGDLAVTADGLHVMVYLGGRQWIQADPGPSAVTISDPAIDPNPWFDSEVSLQRWTLMEAAADRGDFQKN